MMITKPTIKGGRAMKNHKFWAVATLVCFILTMYTGYKCSKK